MASDSKSTATPTTATPKVQDQRRDTDGTLKLGKKMAKVFVGDDQDEPFLVHFDLLIATSDFFKKALTGEFKEKEGVVRLANESAETFQWYMRWLYDQRLPESLQWRQYLDAYVFGVFIQDNKFCNASIDALQDETTKTNKCPTHLASAACEKLPFSSPFIRLLVDFWVRHTSSSDAWFEVDTSKDDRTKAPAEFWVAVAHGITIYHTTKAEDRRGYCVDNKCYYHIHAEGEPRCT
ncbi:hypothetical protein FKW77_000376 [Venturia effusa]|uniref:BTB domain-containing protein n=1 Tax=Venturia effusa TaxID=50376 RepID=A0A517LA77_9PEZI|nr:hypothetical protein FKW77_000376 [Venturia effusa]